MRVKSGFMRQRRAAAQIEAWQERVAVARAMPGWVKQAACAGLPFTAVTVECCEGCPVRLSCLAAARDEEMGLDQVEAFGVRGGLLATQRRAAYVGLPKPSKPCTLETCNSDSAYQRHWRQGETACQYSLDAHARSARERATR